MSKPEYTPTQAVMGEGDVPLSEIISGADAAQSQVDSAVAALDAEASAQPPAPYVYDTETQEVARSFTNQIGRLSRLISEDDGEIDFVEKDRDRQMHELQMRYEQEQEAILNNSRQALEIVNARRRDRVNARGAIQKTIDALQAPK